MDANLLLDVSHCNTRGKPTDSRCTGGDVRVLSDTSLAGWASFAGGWGGDLPYKIYFHAVCDQAFTAHGVWEGDAIYAGENQRYDREALTQEPSRFGVYLRFRLQNHQQVQLKLGISFQGEAQAAENIKREIPHWNFGQVRAQAEQVWNDHLGRISVQGGSLEDRIRFYSLLHNTMIMPTDVTGQTPEGNLNQSQFWEHYTLWDVSRSVMPLHTLILPERQVDMLNGLLDVYDRKGWLPDAWVAGGYGDIQGGTHADVVFADAFVKGLKGFDREKAYRAILKNAEVNSDHPERYGRFLEAYRARGYLPPDIAPNGAVSRSVEYAYGDFCVSQVAKMMGDQKAHKALLKRSKKILDLYYDEEGYFWGRDVEGNWLPNFTEGQRRKDHWNDELFYEGGAQNYSDYVPHAMADLIGRHGSAEAYATHLDEVLGDRFKPSNEQMFLIPYLYHYAGRPSRSMQVVRDILHKQFRLGSAGLPGQDDSGAVSSWYVWSSMGLFPVAGQPIYLIVSPVFEQTLLNLGDGKTFSIRRKNHTPSNSYVVGASLNGQTLHRAYLSHEEIMQGGELLLEMGPEADDSWAQEVPPSY